MNNTEQQTEVTTMRFSKTTRKKLTYIANLESRSDAALIRKVMEDYIRKYEKDHDLLSNPDYIGSPHYDESLDLNK